MVWKHNVSLVFYTVCTFILNFWQWLTEKQGMLFKVNLKAHLETQEVKDTGCGQDYCEDNCRLWCIKGKKRYWQQLKPRVAYYKPKSKTESLHLSCPNAHLWTERWEKKLQHMQMQTNKTPSNLLALTDLRWVSLMIGANIKMSDLLLKVTKH